MSVKPRSEDYADYITNQNGDIVELVDREAFQTSNANEIELADADYFPFYDTSATAKRKTLWSNIKSVLKTYFDSLYATIASVTAKVSWADAEKSVKKNFLDPNYQINQGQVIADVTFTSDANGVVNLDGTSNAGNAIALKARTPKNDGYDFYLPIGRYTFSVNDDLNGKISPQIVTTYNGAGVVIAQTTGTSVDFEITANTNCDYKLADGSVLCAIYLRFENAKVFSNTKIYPLVTKASVKDRSWAKWIPDNTELFPRSEQNMVGVKNLLTFPYHDGTEKTQNGVTFTVNSDGSIEVDTGEGASTNVAQFYLVTTDDYFSNKLKTGKYIISDGNLKSGDCYIALYYDHNGTVVRKNTSNGDIVFDYDASGTNLIGLSLFVQAANLSFDNVVYKPMIRFASDPDDTYVPPAMTNWELTKKKWNNEPILLTSVNDLDDIKSPGLYGWGNSRPTNAPEDYCALEVFSDGTIIYQRITKVSDSVGRIYLRRFYQTWASFFKIEGTIVS